MINIKFHRNFEKEYKKLKNSEKDKVKNRLSIFISDEFSPLLNNHTLEGSYKGYRSINITGDLRAIYKPSGSDRVFVTVGSHSKLYS